MTGWELAISAGAGLVAGVGGTTVGAVMQGRNARRLHQLEAEERRQRHFLSERLAVYVRFLAALAEWEPLRDRARRIWKAEEEERNLPGAVAPPPGESRLSAARIEIEGPHRRFADALQEINLIAPRPVREAATTLFVEAARTGATARFREEFITAVRVDLGVDSEASDTRSPLLDSGVFRDDARQ
jgi:hypothetical protein